ncbi:MAG: type II secretion system protein [Planctomycetota bacterium]|jgi:prepilin-type N-terminal cleavage/methylation domain-containing protein/prepilin-type processing-associated H-X9-DG protein
MGNLPTNINTSKEKKSAVADKPGEFAAAFTPLKIRASNGDSWINGKFLIGFTLIELLVVIAIIALLMSILMAALARTRRQTKTAICQSNLKQWGLLFVMYTGDNHGSFMGGYRARQSWRDALRKYVKPKGGITCCPEAAKKPVKRKNSGSTFEPWGLIPDRLGGYDYGSYGINTWVPNRPNEGIVGRPGTEPWFWRRDDIKGAANVPLLLDAVWVCSPPSETDDPPQYQGAIWSPSGGGPSHGGMGVFCIDRHSGYINCLFVDYNVRKVGLKELWNLKWHRNYNIHALKPNWPNVGSGWLEKYKDYE